MITIDLASGVSVVPIEDIEKKLRARSKNFLETHFTPREIAYCMGKRNRAEHFAARYAAKTACFKALGRPADSALFRQIEVVRKPSGQPCLKIDQELLGETAWKDAQCNLSLAHERDGAIAFVLFSRDK
ncbi:MAG: holo-ACP synthase [Candidatus Omnitrophica bacterium]|nr:holo-ACP synthase [Candidatus Omnitrophota bacterium]